MMQAVIENPTTLLITAVAVVGLWCIQRLTSILDKALERYSEAFGIWIEKRIRSIGGDTWRAILRFCRFLPAIILQFLVVFLAVFSALRINNNRADSIPKLLNSEIALLSFAYQSKVGGIPDPNFTASVQKLINSFESLPQKAREDFYLDAMRSLARLGLVEEIDVSATTNGAFSASFRITAYGEEVLRGLAGKNTRE